MSTHPIHELLKKRILILDGAMGTMIQPHKLEEKDFRGVRFKDWPRDVKGNNDLLVLTRPDVIENIHRAYLEAGADILETNTFNSNVISMADYGMESLSRELNVEGARLAKKVAEEFTRKNPDKPRFVAGSIGPTNRSLGMSPDVNDPGFRAITWDQLVTAYREQVEGLLEGGADLLLVETVFDTLNCKAALFAIEEVFTATGKRVPIMVSVTIIDRAGRNLSGQSTEAFWLSVSHANLLSVGINCALGAEMMRPYVEELALKSTCHISCHPNAGLPNAFGGYDQSAEYMAALLRDFAQSGFLNIVGGCCGTTPAHIRAIAEAVSVFPPRAIPQPEKTLRLSGLDPFTLRKEMTFVNIGERTNITGSPKFAKLILSGDFDGALSVARQQVENGASVFDVNMDEGMLDSEAAMTRFLNLVAVEPDIARAPIMVDSSKWTVLEKGLQGMQGKGIVNSISLKEGEPSFKEKAQLIRRYGAAVVVMAFDENGQADSYQRRIEICKRSYDILVNDVGFPPEDIIFDPNVLTVATGLEEHNNYAVDFIEATRWIKQNLPHARVSGGISNISFSFRGNNPVREAMHSAFLFHAIRAGMDMGIVNAGQLPVYEEIPEDLRVRCEDVILNRRPDATERLLEVADRIGRQLRPSRAVRRVLGQRRLDEAQDAMRLAIGAVQGQRRFGFGDRIGRPAQSRVDARQLGVRPRRGRRAARTRALQQHARAGRRIAGEAAARRRRDGQERVAGAPREGDRAAVRADRTLRRQPRPLGPRRPRRPGTPAQPRCGAARGGPAHHRAMGRLPDPGMAQRRKNRSRLSRGGRHRT